MSASVFIIRYPRYRATPFAWYFAIQSRGSGGHDNKPIELWSNAVIMQKVNYIHNNPVEEGYVFAAHEYLYSSAIDYAGGQGLLKGIEVIDQVNVRF